MRGDCLLVYERYVVVTTGGCSPRHMSGHKCLILEAENKQADLGIGFTWDWGAMLVRYLRIANVFRGLRHGR